MRRAKRAFTIIELLVVVSIIGLLMGILIPAIGQARDQAKLTQSLANLRNLGVAHGSYQAEWADHQFTLIDDNIASLSNAPGTALTKYRNMNGGIEHPGVILGWGYDRDNQGQLDGYRYYEWDVHGGHPETQGMIQPIVFGTGGYWDGKYFGSFRLINCRQFNVYVSGRYYDSTFFAPRDTVVRDAVSAKGCFEDPGEFCPTHANFGLVLQKPLWCSYILSPAAMFNPQVMGGSSGGEFKHPWTLPAGFRSPAASACRYPALKTHMSEHHWLQNRAGTGDCNPGISNGTYDGCEPWYFNQSVDSTPATLFYDGHISTVGVGQAERADGRVRAQSGIGLWSRDTSFGENGYFINFGYDQADTSYHILTTGGILGRDINAE